MHRAFISWDLPVAPAEDAFKSAAIELNAALAKLGDALSSDGAAELFVVLREHRAGAVSKVQVTYDAGHNVVGVDCPLRVHTFEPGTQSVIASLVATLVAAIETASDYCGKNSISFNGREIIQVLTKVATGGEARAGEP